MQGNADLDVKPQIGDGRLLVVLGGKLEPVRKSDVQDVCDEHFWSVHALWYRWKTLGVGPFSGGWAEWPAHITEALEVSEMAHTEAQQQRQRSRNGR
jgi:hypothetical protein